MPLTRSLRALALAMTIGLGACGGDSPSESLEIETIEYGRGGGLAGIGEKLRIDPDGDAEFVADRGIDPSGRFELSLTAGELDDLRGVLEEYPLASLPEVSESECSDCFGYSAAYGGQTYSGDDTTLPDEADRVFSALAEVVEAHVPSRLVYPYTGTPRDRSSGN